MQWINGWVYDQFGPDGLALFRAHPWVYTGAAAAVAAVVVLGAAWWALRRLRRWREDLGIALRLALTADGRRCLAAARDIRRGAVRLRQSIRREIDDRGERRALLAHLDRFTRSELRHVLAQALGLIRAADDPREQGLQRELEWQSTAWGGATEDAERERLQQAIARTRHQLALIAPANAARTRHVRALADAAQAVQALETELAALRDARERALPAFRDHLGDAARRMADLRDAYRALDERP